MVLRAETSQWSARAGVALQSAGGWVAGADADDGFQVCLTR